MVLKTLNLETPSRDSKYLQSPFVSYQSIRHSLSTANIQSIDLPIKSEATFMLYLSFINGSDLNYKSDANQFIDNKYLIPKNLRRIRIFENLSNPPRLYESFDINNLNSSLYDDTMRAYSEYLFDNKIISESDKPYVFSNTQHESKDSSSTIRNESNFHLPIPLFRIQRQMNLHGFSTKDFNWNYGHITRSPLTLILEYDSSVVDSDVCLLITYATTMIAEYGAGLDNQSVILSNKTLIK